MTKPATVMFNKVGIKNGDQAGKMFGPAREGIGIAHVAIAVVYAAALRTTRFAQLPTAMNAASFRFAVQTEAGDGGWHSGGINDILAELRRAHDILIRDDVLQQAVDTLNIGLSEVAGALVNNRGACDRLIRVLGIGNKTNATAV